MTTSETVIVSSEGVSIVQVCIDASECMFSFDASGCDYIEVVDPNWIPEMDPYDEEILYEALVKCQDLAEFISRHGNGAGNYYDNEFGVASTSSGCVPATKNLCAGDFRYWMEKNNTTYYWDDKGFLQTKQWREYKDCGINCLPVDFAYEASTTNVSTTYNTTNWCTFYTLETIKGGSACDYAKYYYQNYRSVTSPTCSTDTSGVYVSDLVSFYSHYGLTLTSVTISSECDMVNKLKDNLSYVLDLSPNHISVVYGIRRNNNGIYKLNRFSTDQLFNQWDSNNADFTDYNQGGGDYVAKK